MTQGYQSLTNLKLRTAKYLRGYAKNNPLAKKVQGLMRPADAKKLVRQWENAEKKRAKAEAIVKANITRIRTIAKKLDAQLDSSKKRASGWLSKGQMSDLFGKK